MEKKNYKKELKDNCKKSCKGRLFKNGKYCECLEKKLPNLRGRSVSPKYTPFIESYPSYEAFWGSGVEDRVNFLKTQLRKYLKNDHEIELIIARVLEEKTFEEVAKEQGWLRASNVAYHVKETIKKLRRMRFKINDFDK